jgi:alkaline phosphatase D
MKLNAPSVGPIIGYTTPTECRLWFRGKFEAITNHSYRRCFGAVRWRVTKQSWSPVKITKLSPNFDMTGVFPLQNLTPGTAYEYQTGWFYADSELDGIRKLAEFDWDNVEVCSFKTPVDNDKAAQSVIVGSCRYLLRLFGGLFFDDRGDKAFSSISRLHGTKPIDAVFMIGDQIYADDLNILSPDKKLDQFFERYQTAFSQTHIRKLMSTVPTYMILDDHEIEDNWPQKATKKDMTTLYPNAIHAYQIYQCSHSPVFDVDNAGWITGTPNRFWYNFSNGCADWFVMDVRTERIWHDDPNKRQMIKSAQMIALLKWLSDGSGKVKMIVSSVPFIPDLRSDADDKWGAYLAERSTILDYIMDHNISKVVFVSGDVHCSFTCELTSPNNPNFKVHNVISSSLFWPYPHMEQNDFVFKGKLLSTGPHEYELTKSSKVHSTDNFARLDIDVSTIKVSYYSRKGTRLGQTITLTL